MYIYNLCAWDKERNAASVILAVDFRSLRKELSQIIKIQLDTSLKKQHAEIDTCHPIHSE